MMRSEGAVTGRRRAWASHPFRRDAGDGRDPAAASARGAQESGADAVGVRRTTMIQAHKLGHLVLKVRDAGKSRDYYTRTLGLKVAHEDIERGTVFLSFGREHHELALFQLATGETPEPTQP